MNILRKTIIKIFAQSSPLHFIGIAIYKIVFHVICSFWKWRFPSTHIWARNSYESKDLVPGLSDIDFTIVTTEDELPFLAIEILNIFKKIFIIMGEVNFYSQKSLDIIKEIYNYYELQRDPLLMSLAKLDKKPNDIDATIYLMRTFESDKHNLENRTNLRQRKWGRVFKLLDITFNELTKNNLVKLLEKRLGLVIINNSMFYSPHTWLEYNWPKLDEEQVRHAFSALNENECDIIIGQIRWEIFGILTQLPFLENRSDMKYHFENLKKIFVMLPSNQIHKLEKILNLAKLLV